MQGGYWPSWFPLTLSSTTKTKLFTHIYYAFLNLGEGTNSLKVSESEEALLKQFISGLRAKQPQVKTLISIGGYDPERSLKFATMASTASNRTEFIKSSIKFARKFMFDGLDLDWEFPENEDEMKNFGILLHEWRDAVENEARTTGQAPLLLAAAVYFSPFLTYSDRAYPVKIMAQKLDWINVMNYDYYGWDKSFTGSHAAFFDPNSDKNSNHALRSWISEGMPTNKVIMGLPLYAKTWTLKDPTVNGIGAPAVGNGPGEGGILPYYQVEKFNKKNNATVTYDEGTVSTYSYSGTEWVGYDDVRSTEAKIRRARGLGLGGYFVWALGFDDDDWKISTKAYEVWSGN